MALNAARLEVIVDADVKGLQTGMVAANGMLGGMASTYGRVALAAGAAGAIAAGAFGVKSVMAASDLNETISMTEQVFGSSSKAILDWSKNSATSFGQSQTSALNAAGVFGNMFLQLGIGAEQATKMSTAQTELASDFASFYNTSPEEAIEAMSAAYRGEYDAVQRFVPTINAAAVEQKALEMGLAGSTKELTAQHKAMATAALLTEGAGKAAGDFDRTSGGLANQMRILKAEATNAMAGIGTALLPVVLKGITLFREWAPIIGTVLKDAWTQFSGAIQQVITVLRPVIDMVVQGFQSIWASVQEVWPQVQAAITDVMTIIEKVVGGVLNVVMALWDVFGETIMAYVKKYFDYIKETISNVMQFIQGFINTVLGILTGDWGRAWNGIKQMVDAVWQQIKNVISMAWTNIKTIFTLALKFLGELWGSFWDGMKILLEGAWKAITDAVQKAWDGIVEWLKGGLDKAKSMMGDAWTAIKTAVKDAWEAVKAAVIAAATAVVEYIKGLPAKFVAGLQVLGGMMRDVAVGAWDKFTSAVATGVATVVGKVQAVPGQIVSALGNLGSLLYNAGKDIIQGLINGIGAMIGNLKRKVGEITGAIGRFFPGSPVKEGPLMVLNQGYAGEQIVKMLTAGIAGQQGAISKVLNDAVPSEIGVGMKPMPGNSTAARGGNGGGGRGTATIILELDGKVIARAVGQPLVDEIRLRTGMRN